MAELFHHGIKGQKWGIRRFQNRDGTLTTLGKKRRQDKMPFSETVNWARYNYDHEYAKQTDKEYKKKDPKGYNARFEDIEPIKPESFTYKDVKDSHFATGKYRDGDFEFIQSTAGSNRVHYSQDPDVMAARDKGDLLIDKHINDINSIAREARKIAKTSTADAAEYVASKLNDYDYKYVAEKTWATKYGSEKLVDALAVCGNKAFYEIRSEAGTHVGEFEGSKLAKYDGWKLKSVDKKVLNDKR